MIKFNDETFEYLKSRVLEMDEVVKKVLQVLFENEEGLYVKEIIEEVKGSEVGLRPVLTSLYTAGFIDKENRGTAKFYKINENGARLLKTLWI